MAAHKTTNLENKTRAAKRVFLIGLFDLSWRLFGAMLLPLFVGLYIDAQRDSGQGFAVAGFLIGMVCGVIAIRHIIKTLSPPSSETVSTQKSSGHNRADYPRTRSKKMADKT